MAHIDTPRTGIPIKETKVKTEHSWVNDGDPPIEKSPKGSEDIIVNDRDARLFAVADGVSSADGGIASRITGSTVNEFLGSNFEKQLENQRASGEVSDEGLDQFVINQIKTAFVTSNDRIKAVAGFGEKPPATTLSLAKAIPMPDGRQKLFYASLGDSRIYFQKKDGKIEQITEDHNLSTVQLKNKLSKEDLIILDQAKSRDSVPKRLRNQFDKYNAPRSKNSIYESIGRDGQAKNVDVYTAILEPGDRLVIVSDGVHDNAKNSDIVEWLNLHPKDDKAAQRAMQVGARKNAENIDKLPWVKGIDDIAGLVWTVPERLMPEVAVPEKSVNKVHQWERQLNEIRKELTKMKADENYQDLILKEEINFETLEELSKDPEKNISKRELLEAEVRMLGTKKIMLETERLDAELEMSIAEAVVDEVDKQVPVQFEEGDTVRFKNGDFSVESYDPETHMYTFKTDGRSASLDRYSTELQQGMSGLKKIPEGFDKNIAKRAMLDSLKKAAGLPKKILESKAKIQEKAAILNRLQNARRELDIEKAREIAKKIA